MSVYKKSSSKQYSSYGPSSDPDLISRVSGPSSDPTLTSGGSGPSTYSSSYSSKYHSSTKSKKNSKSYSSSKKNSSYGPSSDPDLKNKKINKKGPASDPELTSRQRREIAENISDLNSLKKALYYGNSENIRGKLEEAYKLLQSAQDDIQFYWLEPKEKVNEYAKRIEEQKNLVYNVIKKIDEEMLPQIEREITQNKNMLEGV